MDTKKLKTAIRAIERMSSRYRDLISEIDSALELIEVATENDTDVGTVAGATEPMGRVLVHMETFQPDDWIKQLQTMIPTDEEESGVSGEQEDPDALNGRGAVAPNQGVAATQIPAAPSEAVSAQFFADGRIAAHCIELVRAVRGSSGQTQNGHYRSVLVIDYLAVKNSDVSITGIKLI